MVEELSVTEEELLRTPEKEIALHRDVRLLGRLLGEVIERLEGGDLFRAIEQARYLSRWLRAGCVDDLESRLTAL